MEQINIFRKQENPFFNATMIYLIIMTAFVGVRIFGQFGLWISPKPAVVDLLWDHFLFINSF